MAGRTTLDELYVLVPSTEDYDLAEEAEVERMHTQLVREYAALLGPLDDDPSPEHDPAEHPEWRATDAQALGCVEHLLGARMLDDRADAADPADPAEPVDPDR